MTTADLLTGPDELDRQTNLSLRILTIWHILVSIGALGAILIFWLNGPAAAAWLKVISSLALATTALLSILAVFAIQHRKHTGRVISLVINYLGVIVCLLALLHILGIFTGVDALAGTFARGLPYLGIVFVGYLIGALGDRFEANHPARARQFRQAAKIVSGIGALLALFALGILPGLLAIFSRFDNPIPFLLFTGLILFGVMTWLIWSAPVARVLNVKSKSQLMLEGYAFLSPNLLGFLFFFAGPLLFSLYISFTDSDAFGTRNWIGLANYGEILNITVAPLASPDQLAKEVIDITVYDELTRFNLFGRHFVLGTQDKLFWISLGNTIKFVLMAVPLSVIPALFLAVILNSKLPGMKFYRAVYFVPSIAAVVGVALIWRWLYNSTVGYINYFITSIIEFINSLAGSPLLTDPKIGWLSDANVALLAVAIIAAWQWMGFNTVLFLAGLQGISKVLYEAATVDGANAWQQFWKVTLPLLGPTTFFVITTTTIQAMQIFDQVFVLTIPPGGPGTSTTTIVLYLYRQGFQNFRQGYASAIAWILFILIFGLTLFQYLRQRTAGETA